MKLKFPKSYSEKIFRKKKIFEYNFFLVEYRIQQTKKTYKDEVHQSFAFKYSLAIFKSILVLLVGYMPSRANAPDSRVALTSTVCIWLMAHYWRVKSGWCGVMAGYPDILTYFHLDYPTFWGHQILTSSYPDVLSSWHPNNITSRQPIILALKISTFQNLNIHLRF